MNEGPRNDISELVEGLYTQGWVCMEDFLARVDSQALLTECMAAWESGEFRRAAVGRGKSKVIREDIRRDHVLWIDDMEPCPALENYQARLEELRVAINRQLFMGLVDYEGHFAVYPPGAFYKAHLDRHQGTRDRVVTVILYLNPDWSHEDGGRLKIWTTPDDRDGIFEWVEPKMGSLVVFLSGDHWHEVEISQTQRHSLTGWFRMDHQLV